MPAATGSGPLPPPPPELACIMPRRLAVALLALLIPLAAASPLAGCTNADPGPQAGPPTLPDLVFADLGDGTHNLADHRGKVVLVNIWASWCEPCKEELPTLERLWRTHRGDGLEVVGVSIDAHRAEGQVRALVKMHRLTYTILLDPASRVVPLLKVSGYPTTFLFGRDGTLKWRRDGLIPEGDPELAAALKDALAAGA